MKVSARVCQGYEDLRVGEGLPTHSHAPGVAHLCVITVGRAVLKIGDKSFERGPGTYNLPADIPHSVLALDDGTSFYNIF